SAVWYNGRRLERDEQAQRAAVRQLVVDKSQWVSYDTARLDVRLYNPSNTEVHHDVVYRVRVHDPVLNTDFDRRYRTGLCISTQATVGDTVDLGLPFGDTLKPAVTVEWPGAPEKASSIPTVRSSAPRNPYLDFATPVTASGSPVKQSAA